MTAIKILVEKTNTGYSAYAPDLDDAFATSARSFAELKENFEEVLEMNIEYYEEQGNTEKVDFYKNASLSYYLDVEQFFEHFYMINKSAFARFIGMNDSQMRKLSSGIVPLTDKKALQIQNGLHTLAKDLGNVRFA